MRWEGRRVGREGWKREEEDNEAEAKNERAEKKKKKGVKL